MIQTRILSSEVENDIFTAIDLIQKGELVAVPTETVYGLAADARNIDAVRKIFIAKNRPITHPLIVHIASFEKIHQWVKSVPPAALRLAEVFWPGPLTLILEKHDNVNDFITGGLNTIAIRVPKNESLLKILNILDTGLAAPSANPHTRISPTTAEHVMYGLSDKIAAILDAGPCQVGMESTILDLTLATPRILRHGPLSKEMLEDVLKISVDDPKNHSENVPGNMSNHYQPNTKAQLMALPEIESLISAPLSVRKFYGIIHYSVISRKHSNVLSIKMPINNSTYRRMLYSALHDLDNSGVDEILIESPPNDMSWFDILDRVSKACFKRDISVI